MTYDQELLALTLEQQKALYGILFAAQEWQATLKELLEVWDERD